MSYLGRNAENVKSFFSKIAPNYDKLNSFMSLGLHHYWNRKLVKTLNASSKDIYLDVCAGTGAISKIYLKKYRPTQRVLLLDFCPQMLKIAEQEFQNIKNFPQSLKIDFVCSDACQTPLENAFIDKVTVAYGLRNIINPHQALKECFRVMKPGATLIILELTRPSSFWLLKLHSLWLKCMVAGLAAFYSKEAAAYKYLAESINHFVEPSHVLSFLSQAGFINSKHLPLNGQIASLFIAQKPKEFSSQSE